MEIFEKHMDDTEFDNVIFLLWDFNTNFLSGK